MIPLNNEIYDNEILNNENIEPSFSIGYVNENGDLHESIGIVKQILNKGTLVLESTIPQNFANNITSLKNIANKNFIKSNVKMVSNDSNVIDLNALLLSSGVGHFNQWNTGTPINLLNLSKNVETVNNVTTGFGVEYNKINKVSKAIRWAEIFKEAIVLKSINMTVPLKFVDDLYGNAIYEGLLKLPTIDNTLLIEFINLGQPLKFTKDMTGNMEFCGKLSLPPLE